MGKGGLAPWGASFPDRVQCPLVLPNHSPLPPRTLHLDAPVTLHVHEALDELLYIDALTILALQIISTKVPASARLQSKSSSSLPKRRKSNNNNDQTVAVASCTCPTLGGLTNNEV